MKNSGILHAEPTRYHRKFQWFFYVLCLIPNRVSLNPINTRSQRTKIYEKYVNTVNHYHYCSQNTSSVQGTMSRDMNILIYSLTQKLQMQLGIVDDGLGGLGTECLTQGHN